LRPQDALFCNLGVRGRARRPCAALRPSAVQASRARRIPNAAPIFAAFRHRAPGASCT